MNLMRWILLLLVGLTCTSCAGSRNLDPKSMNAASYLTPSEEDRLKELAKHGDAKAAKRLDWFYGEGLGDDREASKWLRIAAEAGDLEAEYNYAVEITVVEDPPTKQTKAEARTWIEKAARGGYKPAIETLARLNRGEPL
jgi:TPR repeat protein